MTTPDTPQPPAHQTAVTAGGDANVAGDVVGRDKIINNIVVVGRMLDYAQVEGLIPQLSQPTDFATISEAFEATFRQRLQADLTQAAAQAGELLGPALAQWTPRGPHQALPYKRILTGVAQPLLEKLVELDYWATFAERVTEFSWIYFSGQDTVEVIWLRSLAALWQKHKPDGKLYGLAARTLKDGRREAVVVWQKPPAARATEAYDPRQPARAGTDFAAFGREEFRLFMVGLVLDCIRLASTVANDQAFWNDLTASLTDGPPG